MHFLILTQYFTPEVGAPQARLASFGAELVRRGHRVTVVTGLPNYPAGRIFPEYRGRWFAREQHAGMDVLRVPLYAATGRGGKRLLNYVSFSVSAIVGAAIPRDVDVVFVESPPLFLGPTGWLAALAHRAPLVLNISDLWPDSVAALGVMSERSLRPFYGLERFLYARAQAVCGTTQGIVRRLRDDKQVGDGRALFLPNGADLDRFGPRPRDAALASELGIAARDKVVLYAGLHGYAQGLGVILDAAERARHPDVRYLLVGDGPEKPALIEAARARRLEARVRFVDAHPMAEMPRFFSLAACSVVPLIKADLFQDALPSKLVISLASGVPPLFSGEGEAARLLESEGCGVVVPPEDAAALATAVDRLAGDDVGRARMAQAARALAERRFAWPQIVSRWLSEIGPLLPAPRA